MNVEVNIPVPMQISEKLGIISATGGFIRISCGSLQLHDTKPDFLFQSKLGMLYNNQLQIKLIICGE